MPARDVKEIILLLPPINVSTSANVESGYVLPLGWKNKFTTQKYREDYFLNEFIATQRPKFNTCGIVKNALASPVDISAH
jgi:hypothetical protein